MPHQGKGTHVNAPPLAQNMTRKCHNHRPHNNPGQQ